MPEYYNFITQSLSEDKANEFISELEYECMSNIIKVWVNGKYIVYGQICEEDSNVAPLDLKTACRLHEIECAYTNKHGQEAGVITFGNNFGFPA